MATWRLPFLRGSSYEQWMRRARSARASGDNVAAVAAYSRALGMPAARATAWVELADLVQNIAGRTEYLRLDQKASAPTAGNPPGQAGFQTALLSPAEQLRAADALRDGGRYAEAAKAYAALLETAADQPAVRVQLGNMLKDSGAFTEAEAAYRQALVTRPYDADIYLQLAHVLKMQGRRPAAMAAYRQASALNPLSAAAVVELASAGVAGGVLANFEAQLRGHAAEPLMALAAEVAAMRARLDQIGASLPEPAGWAAFPVAQYGLFRAMFEVPPPAERIACEITIILEADRETLPTLYRQLSAIRAQSHPQWRLLIVSGLAAHRAAIARAVAADPRIECHASLPATCGPTDWVLHLAEGGVPHRLALGWLARAAALGPAELFVFDEAFSTMDGDRAVSTAVELRPIVDADTLQEKNIWGETIAVRARADGSLSGSAASALIAAAAQGRAGHVPLPLICRDIGLRKDVAPVPPRTMQPSGIGQDRIAVVVPTRDNAADVVVLVESLRRLAGQTHRLTIVVIDNGGVDGADAAQLAALAAGGEISLNRVDEPFNWSRLNNQAIAASDADIIVCANDDMRMLTQGWDDVLRGLLARPEVGAVGVRLLYEDNSIQHAGMLLGWHGGTIHDGLYEPADAPGPADRWRVTRAVGAVTGAFLATSRAVFDQLGGFDAAELPVGFSDVDYALKLRATGLKILWTPQITLYHHESKTRGLDHLDPSRAARDAAERAVMRARWGAAMDFDPGVNPYWHNAGLPFRLISQPSVTQIERYIVASASGHPWRPIG